MMMAKRGTSKTAPKLRFPEFRSAKDWTTIELRQLSEFVTERVGTTKCTPYTVSSGVGLVSQQEKLGRTIAGNSLKNYIVLQKNDFAYNKSATKAFPQGFIAKYVGEDRAAVPNSIFTCFRTDDDLIDPTYLDNLFSTNLHGNWLRNRIAVGARAHGSLNVSDEDLMDLPVPLPAGSSSLVEQQKIADCLTSLDEVIAAQGRKVESLKAHKRGLMQQLFPREGETRPRLRFPEFRNAPEWEMLALGSVAEINPKRPKVEDSSMVSFVPMAVVSETGKLCEHKARPYSEVSKGYTYFQDRDIIVAKITPCFENGKAALVDSLVGGIGAGSTEFHVVRASVQALPEFLFSHITSDCFRRDGAAAMTGSGGQQRVPTEFLRTYEIAIPGLEEQQRTADCLSSLDAKIIAESNQLAALMTHKQGLMQQLFPAPEAVST